MAINWSRAAPPSPAGWSPPGPQMSDAIGAMSAWLSTRSTSLAQACRFRPPAFSCAEMPATLRSHKAKIRKTVLPSPWFVSKREDGSLFVSLNPLTLRRRNRGWPDTNLERPLLKVFKIIYFTKDELGADRG